MAPYWDIGIRIQCLTLLNFGVHIDHIAAWLGPDKSTIYRWNRVAKERGFDPKQSAWILAQYVTDAKRSGRPTVLTDQVQETILKIITKNSTTRQYSLAEIAKLVKVSPSSVWRCLKARGFRWVKPTVKPALTKAMKKKRLDFCHKYRNFDWRNVIWTDETSVILGHRRGSKRVWRRVDERFHNHVIRRRWKGVKEFMFWGAFSYYEKGPYHIWKDESAKEKKAAKADLEARNSLTEAAHKEMWELETGMRRVGLKNKPGKKPVWKYTKETGAAVREGRQGGIDWYRYQEVILKKKLLPWAKKHALAYPGTIVQEDGAPAYAFKHQIPVWNMAKVKKLLWPGNSPDLNAIEPCWWYMKYQTTKRGAATSKKELVQKWEECWKGLEQERIKRWVERIPIHITEIIKCKGGNEYMEGSGGVSWRRRWQKGDSLRDEDIEELALDLPN